VNPLGALADTELSLVAHTIQLAVAPVFLLAGIGAFLNVCAGRLARVIDRARVLEKLVPQAIGGEHDRLIDELRILDRRIWVVNWAIFLSVLAALLTCAVVVLLFASYLAEVNLGTLVALLFMGSMLSIGAGFAIFLVETRLGSRVIHIRNEILYHQAEDGERNGAGRAGR